LLFCFLYWQIGAVGYTWKECGWKTMLLGKGGFPAAAMGLCD
jgi:hypothetical protein